MSGLRYAPRSLARQRMWPSLCVDVTARADAAPVCPQAYEAMQMQQRGGGGGFPGGAAPGTPGYTVGANQFAVPGAGMGGFPGQGFAGQQQHAVMAGSVSLGPPSARHQPLIVVVCKVTRC